VRVELDRLLAPVPGGEAGGIGAQRVTPGAFDLDDVRPEVGEDRGGERGGDVLTDLDDPQATEHLRLAPGGIRSRRMLSGHEPPLRPRAWWPVPPPPGHRRGPDRHGRDRPA
jgi:hypothetical protein